jgi:hypothetical protein
MAAHGTTSEYRSGCRCGPCRAANTAAARRIRARNAKARTRKSKSKVVALPSHPAQIVTAATEMGENEAAIREQCENSPKGSEKPGTVSQATTLARILDNPDYAPMHAQVSRQIHALLLSLDGPRTKARNNSRLAVVQAMTQRNVRTAQ